MSSNSIKRAFSNNSKGMIAASQEHRHPIAYEIKHFFINLFSSKKAIKVNLKQLRFDERKQETIRVALDILAKLPKYSDLNIDTKVGLYSDQSEGYSLLQEGYQLVMYSSNLLSSPSRTVLADLTKEQDYDNLVNKLVSVKLQIANNFTATHMQYGQEVKNAEKLYNSQIKKGS